jgi:hypothetical protein
MDDTPDIALSATAQSFVALAAVLDKRSQSARANDVCTAQHVALISVINQRNLAWPMEDTAVSV